MTDKNDDQVLREFLGEDCDKAAGRKKSADEVIREFEAGPKKSFASKLGKAATTDLLSAPVAWLASRKLVGKVIELSLALVAVVIMISILVTIARVWNSGDANRPATIVELGDWKNGEWAPYSDPKTRFTCFTPAGWSVEELNKGPQSELKLSKGGHAIRVTVRETKVHDMYEGIREEMIEGMGGSARELGRDGMVVSDTWVNLHGSRALQ